jgi:hypothetical protein
LNTRVERDTGTKEYKWVERRHRNPRNGNERDTSSTSRLQRYWKPRSLRLKGDTGTEQGLKGDTGRKEYKGC